MIRSYKKSDATLIMGLIESEGDDWSSYFSGDGKIKYLKSLEKSITHVKVIDYKIVGYIRAIDDHGFDIYICDLLVSKLHRGNEYGKELIESIQNRFKDRDIYVMSDVDRYYLNNGYTKIGSVFKI